MPVVDLSRMGLEGQESFYQNQLAKASANAAQANADKDQMAMEKEKRLQQLGQLAARRMDDLRHRRESGDDLDAEDMADNMDSLSAPLKMFGRVMEEYGMIEEASDAYKNASEIEKREFDMRKGELDMTQTRLENEVKAANLMGTRVGGARNEDEWQLGLSEVEKLGVVPQELIDTLRQGGYNADAAAYLREQALTVYQQKQLEQQQLVHEDLQDFRQTQIDNQQRLYEFAERRHQDALAAQTRAEKNAGNKGSTPGAPSKDIRASVERKLQETVFGEGTVPSAATDFIAARAQQLVREDRTIDWDTAVGRAILAADKAGMFRDAVEGTWIERRMGRGKKTKDFQILPLPRNKAELKKGQTYQTQKGVAVWDGTQFQTGDE